MTVVRRSSVETNSLCIDITMLISPNMPYDKEFWERYHDYDDLETLIERLSDLELENDKLSERVRILEEKLKETDQNKTCSMGKRPKDQLISLGDRVQATNLPFFIGSVTNIGKYWITVEVMEANKIKKVRRKRDNLSVIN